jgi:DNA-directed RNA polymerase alpha subunit
MLLTIYRSKDMQKELTFSLEYWRDRANFFESILDNMKAQRLELQHYTIARLDSENSDLREVLVKLTDTIAVQLKHRTDEVIPKDSDAASYVKAYQSMKIRLDELELSVRIANAVRQQNLETLGDVCKCTEAELLRYPNFGRKSLDELKGILRDHGLSFKYIGVK